MQNPIDKRYIENGTILSALNMELHLQEFCNSEP